jgi:predicted acyltransferase
MSTTPRFTALDVFRGMTLCFMIIVNNQYGPVAFAPLEHAEWDGFTPTDLVFPSFLFAVGNAMAFTMPRLQAMGNAAVLKKILKRTLLIFLIGYLLSWFPFFNQNDAGEWIFKPIENTRIFGVLQRIALCYGMAALLIVYLPNRTIYIISAIVLLGYWGLLYVGGDYTMLGNIGTKIDLWMIGPNHLYKGEGVPFDPEGFLSTFPSMVNVIIGYYAGVALRDKGKEYETITKILIAGVVLVAIAYCWNYCLPINKKLWTGSFVLYTCGIDLLLIGCLVFILDKTNYNKSWTYFFEVFGKNPLFIYILSGIIPDLFGIIKVGPDQSLGDALAIGFFQGIAPGALGTFLFSVSFMLLCWLIGYAMDKKKWYVRV